MQINSEFSIPILFLVFNRPETTERVFREIQKLKPTQLYIAADGARKEKQGEIEKVEQVRKIVSDIDWECDVNTLFRDENLGCKHSVSSAINWFFENVEEGIILEDDCVPEPTFFSFCKEFLDKYKNDERVMMISGTNFLFGTKPIKESYFFSRYYSIWGWATWRRAWNLYDLSMKKWNEYKQDFILDSIYYDRNIIRYYEKYFDLIINDKLDTWDIQWVFACIFNYGLSVVPVNNLISNIGAFGTHINDASCKYIDMPTESIDIDNLNHTEHVLPNFYCDQIIYKNIINKKESFFKKSLASFLIKKGICYKPRTKEFNFKK